MSIRWYRYFSTPFSLLINPYHMHALFYDFFFNLKMLILTKIKAVLSFAVFDRLKSDMPFLSFLSPNLKSRGCLLQFHKLLIPESLKDLCSYLLPEWFSSRYIRKRSLTCQSVLICLSVLFRCGRKRFLLSLVIFSLDLYIPFCCYSYLSWNIEYACFSESKDPHNNIHEILFISFESHIL